MPVKISIGYCVTSAGLLCALCACPVSAYDFNDASAGGEYHLNSSWAGGTANPATDKLTPEDVLIDESRIDLDSAGDATNDTIEVDSGGTLGLGYKTDILIGGTVVLDGGTLTLNGGDSPQTLRGDIIVTADSLFTAYSGTSQVKTPTFDSLTMRGTGVVFTIARTGNKEHKSTYTELFVEASSEIACTALGSDYTSFGNVAVNSNAVLRLTGEPDFFIRGVGNTNFLGTILLPASVDLTFSFDPATGGLDAMGPGTVVLAGAGSSLAVRPSYAMPGAILDCGGQIVVQSNATIRYSLNASGGGTTSVDRVTIENSGVTLSIANSTYKGRQTLRIAEGLWVEGSSLLRVVDGTGTGVTDADVLSVGLAVDAERTLTLLREDSNGSLTLTGGLGARLKGGADILSSTNWNMTTNGVLTRSDVTPLTSGGLWTYSNTGNGSSSTPIGVTLGKRLGIARAPTGRAKISPSEAAGSVEITGLVPGTLYKFDLDLVDFDAGLDVNDIAAHMAGNPAFIEVETIDANTVRFGWVAAGSSAFFAWDNFPGSPSDLGADVMSFGFLRTGTVIICL